MKIKKIVGLFFIISWFSIKAQVGIGNTSPNAQLDISSSNQATPANTDGILIPKINAFPATNPTASQQGMLVYLTTTVTFAAVSRSPGFYYWDNGTTNWIGFQNTSSTDWNILGNTGTIAGTNFFGTIDNKDITFKRFNIRAGYIGDPFYDASYNFNNGNTSFGANSMKNPTVNIGTQTGVRNTAFGTNVMPAISTGKLNTGIGEFALFSLSSGIGNTSLGSASLFSNSTANSNVAVGRNTLTSSNSDNNTGIGFASLKNTTSGASNTTLGYNTGYLNSTGSYNVFIGSQAGYNEGGSNKLYIEKSTAVNGTDSSVDNALIYGDFGSSPRIVRANAQLQVGNPTVSGYVFPTTRGNSGQMLQTDGAGGTSWADSASNFSIVRTNLSANQGLGTGGWQKLNFNTVVFDTKSEFNTSTNRFVATNAGYYEINAGFHTDSQNNNQYYSIAIYKNGSEYQETTGNHTNLGPVYRTINAIIYLAATDYVEIYAQNYQSGVNIDSYSGKTFFEVRQIK